MKTAARNESDADTMTFSLYYSTYVFENRYIIDTWARDIEESVINSQSYLVNATRWYSYLMNQIIDGTTCLDS